jgi:hypothetical protein
MKKLISVFLSLSVLVSSVFAQENITQLDANTIANMSLSELQAYQKTLKVQQQAVSTQMPSPSKLQEYALVGKALGQAFKECWSTVSTDAEKFAQSDAGKWTAFLITWKVMGKDAIDVVKTTVRWAVGIGLFIFVTPFFMFIIWKNCVVKKVMVSCERNGVWSVKKTYSESSKPPIHESYLLLYGACYLVFIGTVSGIMFVN